ncbi:unnamed protein product [Oreochromis niloticus]|nr:unnamed protein product [Mustela putorius furo]
MEDVPSDPPDEEFPGPSERPPRRKRRSRRRRGAPQPDVGICKQPAVVSERDTFVDSVASVTAYSGAIFSVLTEDNNDSSISPMAIASKTACSEPSFRVYDRVRPIVPSSLPSQSNARPVTLPAVQSAAQLPAVQSAAQLPAVQSAAPPPVTTSPPVAQLPPVQQPTHSFIQSPSSPSHYEQGTHFTTTSAGSLKLVISETIAPSRASPEAGCRSPANSGPLEVKTPAPAAPPENSPEQSQLSAPPESSSEFTHLPPSSAECTGEHFQPSGDCIPLLLPESSHCAAQSQPVSTLAEVCIPAASVSVSTGGPEEPVQSQATSAGGSGEPVQPQATSAGGSEEPVQPQAKSVGGPESPVQSQVSSAGGPASPVQLQAKSAGGSEEPTQHHTSLAEGPGGPRQHILPSAGGPGRAVQPSPAESSPATSTSSPAASTSSPAASTSSPAAVPLPSGSAAVPLPSGSAAVSSSTPGPVPAPPSPTPGPVPAPPSPGPASSSPGPVVATLSWDPARPVPPRLCWPLSRPLVGRYGRQGRPPERDRRHCWHRSRPPDLLSGRHCLPSGRPPDGFCLHRRRCHVHGRPPDLLWLLYGRPPGRPPELFADSC